MSKKSIDPLFSRTGRKGGKKTLEKYGKSHFSKIATERHRAEARKRKLLQSGQI